MNSQKAPSWIRRLWLVIIRYWWLFCLGGLLLPIAQIPIRLAIAMQQAPAPQSILVLGGDPVRDKVAAQLAHYYPYLDIWVSSSAFPDETQKIFKAARISENRVHQDFRASDTVTNFTSLVPEFKARRIHHLYLVTSSFHMPRAKAIAILVLGSNGIAFTPVTSPPDHPKESLLHITRDGFRSILWIFTGWTGVK
jgi:uncharacterized SAM-binding protein YcdF (DUF218 family)